MIKNILRKFSLLFVSTLFCITTLYPENGHNQNNRVILTDKAQTNAETPTKIIFSGTSCSGKSEIIFLLEKYFNQNQKEINSYTFIESTHLEDVIINNAERCIKILLYCPLTVLPYYITWHNRKLPNKTEHKSLRLALEQFFSLFYTESRGEPYNKKVIASITRRDLDTFFSYRENLLFPEFSNQKSIDEYLDYMTVLFKNHFSFKQNTEEILIAPIHDYDLIINTALYESAFDIAMKIIEQLQLVQKVNQ